jgi:hypothetical protein
MKGHGLPKGSYYADKDSDFNADWPKCDSAADGGDACDKSFSIDKFI